MKIEANNPKLETWLEVPLDSDFPIQNIPFGIINGRITKKSFKNWKIFPNFSKKIFSKFKSCMAASNESKIYLKRN